MWKRGWRFLRWLDSRGRRICSCSYNGSTPAVPSFRQGGRQHSPILIESLLSWTSDERQAEWHWRQSRGVRRSIRLAGAHTARPCKIYCNNGHINTRLLLFHFHRLFSRSSPHHMPHSVLLRPRAPFILLCTPAALHSRTHVRTSSKLISSKPPSWQVADAGHARHDTRDWGGHWHAHTHRHAHCAHGIAGHHWVEHHRVEHLVRDAWWANADEWWWSRE